MIKVLELQYVKIILEQKEFEHNIEPCQSRPFNKCGKNYLYRMV
jgi:hypothetical protein